MINHQRITCARNLICTLHLFPSLSFPSQHSSSSSILLLCLFKRSNQSFDVQKADQPFACTKTTILIYFRKVASIFFDLVNPILCLLLCCSTAVPKSTWFLFLSSDRKSSLLAIRIQLLMCSFALNTLHSRKTIELAFLDLSLARAISFDTLRTRSFGRNIRNSL